MYIINVRVNLKKQLYKKMKKSSLQNRKKEIQLKYKNFQIGNKKKVLVLVELRTLSLRIRL